MWSPFPDKRVIWISVSFQTIKNKKPEQVLDLCTILFPMGLQAAPTAESTNRLLPWKYKHSNRSCEFQAPRLVLHIETQPILTRSLKAISAQVQTGSICTGWMLWTSQTPWKQHKLHGGEACFLILYRSRKKQTEKTEIKPDNLERKKKKQSQFLSIVLLRVEAGGTEQFPTIKLFTQKKADAGRQKAFLKQCIPFPFKHQFHPLTLKRPGWAVY